MIRHFRPNSPLEAIDDRVDVLFDQKLLRIIWKKLDLERARAGNEFDGKLRDGREEDRRNHVLEQSLERHMPSSQVIDLSR